MTCQLSVLLFPAESLAVAVNVRGPSATLVVSKLPLNFVGTVLLVPGSTVVAPCTTVSDATPAGLFAVTVKFRAPLTSC